jgi:hypothetical protein
MSDYLVMYEGGDKGWMKRPPKEFQKAMEEWGAWFKELESKGSAPVRA